MWRFLDNILGIKHPVDNIDEDTAALIMRLHEQHPTLGRRGLHKVLEAQAVDVKPADLKRFLRSRGIRIEGRDSTPPPSSTFPPFA